MYNHKSSSLGQNTRFIKLDILEKVSYSFYRDGLVFIPILKKDVIVMFQSEVPKADRCNLTMLRFNILYVSHFWNKILIRKKTFQLNFQSKFSRFLTYYQYHE